MIVCWVLFSFSVVLTAVGGGLFFYYESEVEAANALISQHRNASGNWTAQELLEQLRAEQGSATPEAADKRAKEFATLKAQKALIAKKQADWLLIALFSLMAGGVLLFWNILCHTVHWIWMGRKESE